MKRESSVKVMRCGLGVTDNARKGIKKYAKGEHALFSMQEAFDVHIEKRPQNRHGNLSFSIYFDNVTNKALSKHLNDRVAVMECVYKNENFLATGFHVRGRKEPVRTNRRHAVRLRFILDRNTGVVMPIDLYTSLRELPIAEERSAYVEKRIASWEGYLQIQEKNADVADLTTAFSKASLNADFSKLSLVCNGLEGKEWHAIKGFSVKMKGLQNDIGNVVNTNRAKRIVEIELNRNTQELARRNEWHPKSYKEAVFSNFAELSQVRRLRKGFKDLQDGLAANSNLEKVLFEERPVVRISKQQQELVFHNELNKFQKEAVTGAMTSNDLYVIQGPPGTGKTTVISEICHQNVKAGLRTLVASQANLAVDNALGRLLSHQDIRILRYGRTESIEEEGKRFIEENVALNWRSETVDAVNQQLQSNAKKEAQLEADLESCEDELQQLQKELVLLEEKISEKEAAQREHEIYTNEREKLSKKASFLKQEREELLENQVNLKKSADEFTSDMNRLEQQIKSESFSPETVERMEKLVPQLEGLRQYINYRQTVQHIGELENTIANMEKELETNQRKTADLHNFVTEIPSIMKLDVLNERMTDNGITPPSGTDLKMIELHQLIATIKSEASTDEYNEWQKLSDRLAAATTMMERLLKDNGFLTNTMRKEGNQKYTSVQDINGLVDRVGYFLVKPSTKKILESRSYSAEKYDYLEKIAVALELLRERSYYVRAQMVQFEKQHQTKLNAKNLFALIKTEITEHVNQFIVEIAHERSTLHRDIEGQQQELNRLQQTSSALRERLDDVDETLSMSQAQQQLEEQEKIYADYENKKAALERYAHELDNKMNDAEVITQKLEKSTAALHTITEELAVLNVKVLELEQQLAPLVERLKENPEARREQTLRTFYARSKEAEQLTIDKERLPITHTLQKEWFSLLTEANDYDLDEIRKLYVQHANVIGTTCVASARRDFMEEYPTFDVVIIDEVSKATPPELLLPMLKGKKIILVGDHHQLPPLIGQETLEEFLEEIDIQDDRKEFEQLLNESLFERLFRTLPKQNKTMLGIQYRMHESIMQTITPFYEEGNYSLQCGLTDSDAMRDHLIDSHYIQRTDHLLWFDMPNKPNYFEDKVKGGTSRFNQAELLMVKNLLVDVEEATKKAKQDGTMQPEDKKSVGVISFYGEQVKRIDRLIQQELVPQHLHCRTGSVDKFQGMEMDVIILSFVRNHGDRGGDIGFARDYRRLNVALSRARELLIIVGSSEMFTIRPKHASTKEMYGRLLADIKLKNGFRDHEGNIKL